MTTVRADAAEPSPAAPAEFTATASLSVRCVRAAALDAGDYEAWQGLYEASGTANPFLHPAWTLAAVADGGRGTQVWLVQVHAGAELVAVAALELAPLVAGLPGVRVLRVAGSHRYSCLLEMPGILTLPRYARCALRAIVEYLASRAGEWSWWHLPLGEHDSWLDAGWLPGGRGFVVSERLVRAEVVLDVGDGRLRSRNLRESVRRARNRLTRDFGSDWAVTRVVDPEPLGRSLDSLVQLHRERSTLAGRRSHDDRASTAAVRRYLGDVVARHTGSGSVSCYELRARGTLIAQLLTFHAPAATYCSLSGLTATAWQYSPTTLLQWQAYQDTRADGRRAFSLSTGPDQAKLRWSRELRVHPEFVVISPRPGARLAYALYSQVSHAARLLAECRRQLAGRSGIAAPDGSPA
jgi:CelD/BcsL family acetyltransferase involved in cellulose biosynthesis